MSERGYPKDWAKISARIRERAGHRCEECDAKDGELLDCNTGDVVSEGKYAKRKTAAERKYYENRPKINLESLMSGDYDNGYYAEGEFYPMNEDSPKIDCGVARIYLEVHHKDKNPSNNADANLVCLCLRCHNEKHGSQLGWKAPRK